MLVQFSPAFPVARGRDNATVCEDRCLGIGCQVARHEGHLDDGAQVQAQQVVENAVYGCEIVLCLPLDLPIQALLIAQDGMSANM